MNSIQVAEAAKHAKLMFPGPIGREIYGTLTFHVHNNLRFFGTNEHELVTEIYRLHNAGFRLTTEVPAA